MKQECLKYLLDCYLQNPNEYDEIDGYFHAGAERSTLLQMEKETSWPVAENDGLSAEQETLVREIASQLKNFSWIFEKNKKYGPSVATGNIIQFRECCIFVPIKECKAVIAVITNGSPLEGTIKVKWKTKDGTALSGHNFIDCEGEISFSKEEKQKLIEIQLLDLKEGSVHFQVELFNSFCEEEDSVDKITVFITNNNLSPNEKQTIKNILRPGKNICFPSVIHSLNNCVTTHTFQTALQYLCGSTDSLPVQLTYACELTKIALKKAQRESLYNVVCNFFQNLPEMEEIIKNFH